MSSNLYKAKKPNPGGGVVMVLVERVNKRRATTTVSLLEYGSGTMKGSVTNFSTEVGRIQPMKVVKEEENGWILDGNISTEERNHADQRYLKAKFVRYLLAAVANDVNNDVEDILRAMNWPWPSYEDLDSFRTTFNESFKKLLSGSKKKKIWL